MNAGRRASFAVLLPLAATMSGAIAQAPGAGSETAAPVVELAERPVLFGGVRLWASQYDVPTAHRLVLVRDATTIVEQDAIVNATSKYTFAPIPFAGVRFNRFVVSASYLPSTRYDTRNASIGVIKRDELDLSVGYSILPSLVVAAAYKRVAQDRTARATNPVTGESIRSGFQADGVALGASASLPLSGSLSLYGNVAFGAGRSRLDSADAAGQSRLDLTYRNGEVGISYLALERARDAPLQSILVSAGYRAQVITTRKLGLGTYAIPSGQLIDIDRRDLTTTTDGVVVGIVAIF
jgi:hypothetical protein